MDKKIKVYSRIWVTRQGKNYLGKGRIELLKRIAKSGSIAKASKQMRMSYKAAWDDLNQIKDLGGVPLIASSNGGKGGGGTSLTQEGKKAIVVFEELERFKEEFCALFEECENLDELLEKIEYYKILFEKLKK